MDEFFCKGCKKSMVGADRICLNCGHDMSQVPEMTYDFEEDEGVESDEAEPNEDDFIDSELDFTEF